MNMSFYLEHLAGSVLLLFPLALLLFFPYGKEHRRVRPLARYLLLAGLVAASVVSPFFTAARDFELFLSLAMLALIAAFYILIRDSFTRKSVTLFVSVFCLKAQTVLALSYQAVRELASGAEPKYGLIADGDTVLMLLLAAAVLVPLVAFFERRILTPYLRAVSRRIMWLEILLLAIVDFTFLLLAFFFVGMFIGIIAETKTIPAWCVVPGLFLFFFALYAMYFVTFRTTLLRAFEVENRLQTELLRENSESLQRDMKHYREINHDLRQLLRQLDAVSGRSGFRELEPYINRIVNLTEHMDTVFCENKCLNALFQYYAGHANERNVAINISAICGDVPVEDTDLTLLTANALENAINGAAEYRSQTGEEPEIHAIVGIIKHRLLFQITNSCAGVKYSPDVTEGAKHTLLPACAFLSTHESGGYGLTRIEMIAEKYQGTARFQFDAMKSLWTTRIAIPLRK